jgi:hypothetical protein
MTGLMAIAADTVAVPAVLVAVVEAELRVVLVVTDDAGASGDVALRCLMLMRNGLRLMWGTKAFPNALPASRRSGML